MKAFLDRIRSAFEPMEAERGLSEDDLKLAAAVLMVELSRADYEVNDGERRIIRKAVMRSFDLAGQDADELIEAAEAEADAAVSLYRYTGLINAHWGPDEKDRLIETLWRVALSDDEMHHFEEHLVRKMAGLLHVPPHRFLKAKHRVQKERGEKPG